MNNKEIRELKKRFRQEHSNIQDVNVCYVSSSGEIISRFRQSLTLAAADEQEKYLKLFQKCLSGSLNRQLHNLSFRTSQVAGSEEHSLLTGLRDSKLRDEDKLTEIYEKIISSVHYDSNFAIVSAYDAYDVPKMNKDGSFDSDGDSVFRYILFAVCPVKLSKCELTYIPDEKEFHNRGTDAILDNPDIAFLFPAFDDRSTNLYGSLYYTKSAKDSSEDFVSGIFCLPAPVPAQQQKEDFMESLSGSLEEDCTLDTVKAVQNFVGERIQMVKEAHLPDLPTLNRKEISELLEERNIPEEKVAAFNVRFDEAFGSDSEVSAPNLMNPKRIEIKTADALIQVSAEMQHLVDTRTIGENKYICVRVQDGDSVTVNGVEISIPD